MCFLCGFYEETAFLLILVELRLKQAEQEGVEHVWMADDWKLRSNNSRIYARGGGRRRGGTYRKQQPSWVS